VEIIFLPTPAELSRAAAERISRAADLDPGVLLCAATGDTPTQTYELLQQDHQKNPARFSKMRVVKLDEWAGLAMNDPGTCETYLQQHLLGPLRIPPSRYISFDSAAADPQGECRRIAAEVKKEGPIGVCILGIGVNGHIALNEPADIMVPFAHVAGLAETTSSHGMLAASPMRPRQGLTLGLTEIFSSRQILLLITGEKKRAITAELLSGRISTSAPASLLWLHPAATVLIDRAAAGSLFPTTMK
jgi:galactosamine-6-phosphate isomerase